MDSPELQLQLGLIDGYRSHVTNKQCSECNKWFYETDFPSWIDGGTGELKYRTNCYDCRRAQQKRQYKTDKKYYYYWIKHNKWPSEERRRKYRPHEFE